MLLASKVMRALRRRERELRRCRQRLARQSQRLRALACEVQEVQEGERRRIALELHDTVARQIAAALFALEGSSSDAVSPAVRLACLSLRQAHTEIHRTIFGIRPPMLGGSGLTGSLRGLINAFRTEFGGEVQLSYQGALRRLTPAAETAVYRTVQEGLRNISTHSDARRVELNVEFTPAGMRLVLRDDGQGFDADRIDDLPAQHLGILGMRQRLEDIGGDLTVTSHPDAGTELTLVVPAYLYTAGAVPDEMEPPDQAQWGGKDALCTSGADR